MFKSYTQGVMHYAKMFEAYDKMCAEQPANPNCIYAK
jgi:hypothetical protein